MSLIVINQLLTAGKYVPFRGIDRSRGICGTCGIHLTGTGDASGGTMTVAMTHIGNEFGFPHIIVPTTLVTRDGLGTGINVKFQFLATGHDRLADDYSLPILVTDMGSENLGQLDGPHPPIEAEQFNDGAAKSCMQADWATNTDGANYEVDLFCSVYDRQAIANKQTQFEVTGPLAGRL